jgi:Cu/Ag efflux protein CusF
MRSLARPVLASVSLLVVAACATTGSSAAAPESAASFTAQDLGSSSRVKRIAALAGEGEGYGTPSQQVVAAGPAAMAGMQHDAHGGRTANSAMPADHAGMAGMSPSMSHGAPDQGKAAPDHSAMPGMEHRPAGAMAQGPAAAEHAAMPGMSHSSTEQQTAQAPQAQAPQAAVQGNGTLNSIDTAARKVNLSHEAIPAIGWPAMTMDFAVAPSVNLATLKSGTHVAFTLNRGNDGMYVIQSITPAHGGH